MKRTFISPEVSSVELDLSQDAIMTSFLADKNAGISYDSAFGDTEGANTPMWLGDGDWE